MSLIRRACLASLSALMAADEYTHTHAPKQEEPDQARLPGLAERLNDPCAQHVQHCRLRARQLPARQPLPQPPAPRCCMQ